MGAFIAEKTLDAGETPEDADVTTLTTAPQLAPSPVAATQRGADPSTHQSGIQTVIFGSPRLFHA